LQAVALSVKRTEDVEVAMLAKKSAKAVARDRPDAPRVLTTKRSATHGSSASGMPKMRRARSAGGA